MSFSDDIDGDTRPWPAGGAWDIGADEYSFATIYRSVGPNKTTYLSRGNGSVGLTISGSTATFTSGRPDNIGVGDAIVYNSNANIVFISGRASSTVYTVQDADGTAPDTTASGDTGWYIYRAYTSLDAAESGEENTGIPSGIRNFDDWEPGGTAASDDYGRDLVANNELWNIACYADAADTVRVIFGGWNTGPENYLRVYTPYLPGEVGASQRHNGVWDDDKYKLQTSGVSYSIDNSVKYIRIDGLQIETTQTTTLGVPARAILNRVDGIIYISNNIVFGNVDGAGYWEAISIFNGDETAYIWNNIIYNWGTGIYSYGRSYAYNNTIINCEYGISEDYPAVVAANNITQDCTGDAFDGTFLSGSGNNISDDDTAPGSNSAINTTLNFFDRQNKDFHLSPDDAAALDAGTSSVSDIVTTDIDGAPIHTYDIGADDGSQYFESTVMESGGDFSGLAAWENANDGLGDIDLTATSTLVFNCASANGAVSAGTYMYGETSGASGTATVLSTVTNQILLYNIKASSTTGGYFQSGEKIYVQGASPASNYCITANAGNPAIAVAKIDGAWSGADNSRLTINGWTTGEYNYIKIYTTDTARHQGKWDDNKYRLSSTNHQIVINASYVKIDGLQIYLLDDSTGFYVEGDNSGTADISNNIIRSSDNNNGTGIGQIYENSLSLNAYNNLIYDCKIGMNLYASADVSRIYSNTLYNIHSKGMWIDNTIGYSVMNNVVIMESGDAFDGYSGGWEADDDYNISNDGSAPGVHSKTGASVSFLDSANNDFHLSPSDTAARDSGTSTAYSLLPTAYDIDGTARGEAFDIGADEVPVEYVSTICENTAAGGDCADMDYSDLADWEDAVEADIASSATRIFSGSGVGELSENDSVSLYWGGATDSGIAGTVVATTSDQIMVDWIAGTTSPVIAHASDTWRKDASNYWTITGTGDALGASPIAVAKIDGAWSASSTYLDIDGWSTDNDNYIKVYTTDTARHDGKWDYTKFRFLRDSTDGWAAIDISEEYVWLDGLQIMRGAGAGGQNYPRTVWTWVDNPDSDIKLSNNIFRADFVLLSGAGSGSGIEAGDFSDEQVNLKLWNNIFYDFTSPGAAYSNAIYFKSGYGEFYNNTFYNNDFVITASGLSYAVVVNNLAANTTASVYTGSCDTGSGYNASDNTDTCGTNSRTNQTFSFVSTTAGAEDFHLAANDGGAKDYGTSTPSSLFSTDIDGNSRPWPAGGAWDIGADEYSFATIYRSVGPDNTTYLSRGNGSVGLTISGSTATFTSGRPDNIGVGDAIVYNSNDNIVFISGRASSTAYTVQDADGTAPDTTASGDTGWYIYRAYTSLYNAEYGIENTGIPSGLRNFDDWEPGGTAASEDYGRDLVANKESWNIACYADTEYSGGGVTIDDWTTGPSNYLKIYTPYLPTEVGESQRHNGAWDTSRYRLKATASGSSYTYTLKFLYTYIWVDGLQIEIAGETTNEEHAIVVNPGSNGNAKISNNIIRNTTTATGWNAGIILNYTATVWDNIVYDFGNEGILAWGWAGSTGWIYNNTVINCNIGISRDNSNFNENVRNNIVQGCDTGFYHHSGWNSNSYNNLSDDDTAPGSNSVINTTLNFFDRQNKDFHLSPDDAAALDTGTSSVSDIVTTDIDGDPIHTYDIGADDGSQYFVSSIKYQGVDAEFGTLSTWEDANDVDLTATNTLVFNCSSADGGVAAGTVMAGETSGATGKATVLATSSNQLLLYDITASSTTGGYFQTGEKIYIQGASSATNYCITANSGNSAIAVAKIDGAWAGADTNTVYIDGWTTGKYNYIRIYTTDTARHQGKWDENKYNLALTGDFWNTNITVVSSFVRIDGLQIKSAWSGSGSSNYLVGIDLSPYSSDNEVQISNNIIQGVIGDGTGDYGIGHNISSTLYTPNCRIWNNVIYGYATGNTGSENGNPYHAGINLGYSLASAGGQALVYNNTLYGNDFGIYLHSNLPATLKNNISNNNGYDYHDYGGGITSSANNISETLLRLIPPFTIKQSPSSTRPTTISISHPPTPPPVIQALLLPIAYCLQPMISTALHAEARRTSARTRCRSNMFRRSAKIRPRGGVVRKWTTATCPTGRTRSRPISFPAPPVFSPAPAPAN